MENNQYTHGQLVWNPFNNTTYEVSLRLLQAGVLYRSKRIKEPVVVTSFIAFSHKRRLMKQLMQEKGMKLTGRQKVRFRKLNKKLLDHVQG